MKQDGVMNHTTALMTVFWHRSNWAAAYRPSSMAGRGHEARRGAAAGGYCSRCASSSLWGHQRSLLQLLSIQAGRLLVRQPPAAPAPQALSPEPAPVPELAIVSTLRAKCSRRMCATRPVPSGLFSRWPGPTPDCVHQAAVGLRVPPEGRSQCPCQVGGFAAEHPGGGHTRC